MKQARTELRPDSRRPRFRVPQGGNPNLDKNLDKELGQILSRAMLAAVAAPEAVNVPVDTSPTVVKFPALAVLLMVSVLPVIPVAHAGRPRDAQRGAGGRQRVAVSAAQETAPDRRENVSAVHVVAQQRCPEPVQRGRAQALSLEGGVFHLVGSLALVRPGNDLVLRRIRKNAACRRVAAT